MNFSSMAKVTGCPSSFICIFLPTSASVSGLTASLAMLVNLFEKDTGSCLSPSLSKGLYFFKQSKNTSNASTFRFTHLGEVFVKWTVLLYMSLHELSDVREIIEYLHPAFMARITTPHSSSG